MIKEIKGNTKLEHYGDSFIARIPDNIIDLLVLENNQKFLISIQGESIVLTPEVKQPNMSSNWEDNGIRHKEVDWEKLKEMKESIKVGIIYLIIRLKQRFSTLFSFYFITRTVYSIFPPTFLRFILLF